MWNQGMEIFPAQCEGVAIRSLSRNLTSLHHREYSSLPRCDTRHVQRREYHVDHRKIEGSAG